MGCHLVCNSSLNRRWRWRESLKFFGLIDYFQGSVLCFVCVQLLSIKKTSQEMLTFPRKNPVKNATVGFAMLSTHIMMCQSFQVIQSECFTVTSWATDWETNTECNDCSLCTANHLHGLKHSDTGYKHEVYVLWSSHKCLLGLIITESHYQMISRYY